MSPSETGASEDDSIGAADGEAVVSVVACATSGGDEREVGSVTLERDPRRQQQTVRVSNAASRAGRRVRLRVVGGHQGDQRFTCHRLPFEMVGHGLERPGQFDFAGHHHLFKAAAAMLATATVAASRIDSCGTEQTGGLRFIALSCAGRVPIHAYAVSVSILVRFDCIKHNCALSLANSFWCGH